MMTLSIPKIANVPDGAVERQTSRVIAHKRWSDDGFELIFERKGLCFDAGRLITLHGRSLLEDRSYTISSGEQDPHLHVLYRVVPNGVLTPQLATLTPEDEVQWSGPYGQFVVRDPQRPLWFIATGTGIAPCRAYLRTYPDIDLTVVHGVRREEELFFRPELESHRYIPCLTQQAEPFYHGRVTAYLENQDCPTDAHYYLCGAYEMIYDMQALLIRKGVPATHIFVEGYYYKLET